MDALFHAGHARRSERPSAGSRRSGETRYHQRHPSLLAGDFSHACALDDHRCADPLGRDAEDRRCHRGVDQWRTWNRDRIAHPLRLSNRSCEFRPGLCCRTFLHSPDSRDCFGNGPAVRDATLHRPGDMRTEMRRSSLLWPAVLTIWFIVVGFPLYWMAITAFKEGKDVFPVPTFLPWIDFQPTLSAFEQIFGIYRSQLFNALKNSAIASLLGAT